MISNMMKHIYYLTDEELLLRWPALRGGSIDDRLVQDEQRRYRDEADSIEADVLVLGPENGPRECTKRDRSPWRPAEFAEQLRAHLRVLCTKRKKPRRAVIEDSDSDEQAAPTARGGASFVAHEAKDDEGGEDDEGEEDSEEVDCNGNLRGFVVPDDSEEMESEVGSPSGSADVASSPGVAIVGQRSRAERDAEGRVNAINLITPPRP